MKTITFAVPCYNSADYMDACIESILKCGDDIEIVIVDDGSTKDDTPAKADAWAAERPDVVRGRAPGERRARPGRQHGPGERVRPLLQGGRLRRLAGRGGHARGHVVPACATRPGRGGAGGDGPRDRQLRVREGGGRHAHRHALPQRVPRRPRVRLGRGGPLRPEPVPAHALGRLPHRAFARHGARTPEAHVLRGQHLRVRAAAAREDASTTATWTCTATSSAARTRA